MEQTAPKTIRLQDYRPPEFLIDAVSLEIALDPASTRVRSRLKVRPNPEATGAAPLILDGQHLVLEKVTLDGRPLKPKDYEVTGKGLTLPRPPRVTFELEIDTVCNPDANAALSGLYRSRGIYCTQCEPEGFRRITYYVDRPAVLAVFTTRIEASEEAAPILLANGNPIEQGKLGKGRHFAVWHDPHPKPSYLFAMVGGKLSLVRDSFTTMSGRKVELRIYVEPGQEKRCAWAMDSLKRSMRWDEERFGREYDLDVFMIVAVSDFNMGAMENKGLNIFNDKLVLARPDSATDADYTAIEAVIAHEYFHNWSGNRVTCRDWFQLCLKEGLTVFRDQEFTGDLRSRPVERIGDVRMLRTYQFPEDAGPLAHAVRPDSYIEINNFYTATVYEKGAELCRMIQTMLGREGFRKGLDLYFERHDGQAATVEDFLRAMEDASGVDLTQFSLWYRQAGTPELAYSASYDAKRKALDLTLSQVTPPTPGQRRKEPLHIPVKLGLVGKNGADLPITLRGGEELAHGVLHLREREQVFRFENVTSRPILSLLREFSAPVKVSPPLGEGELEFLMANDSDPFNRWQASQSYALQIMVQTATADRKSASPRGAKRFARALAVTLQDESLEHAFRGECLKLPSESDIAREIGRNVDPDAVYAARKELRALIGNELRDALVEIYEKLASRGAYTPDAASVGRRALRNGALLLLAATGEPEQLKRTRMHFDRAKNMTDTMAALTMLNEFEGELRDKAFAKFFEAWKDDHLVIDKWFALQGLAPLPGALARVQELAEHPLFSLRNPNKVRALIGAFAHQNPVGFNRRDGRGYAYVADKALAIDAFNPQLAAQLFGAFKSWRMLEPKRRAKAKAALEGVMEHGSLSRNCYEIVSKTLE